MPEQIDVEVGDGDRVDTGGDGVGLEIAGPMPPVHPTRRVHGDVPIRCVERAAVAKLRVKMRQVEKQIPIDVGSRENDLAELHLRPALGVGGNPLQRSEEAPVAHAMRNDIDALGPAAAAEVGEEIGDRPFARVDRRLVGRVGGQRPAGRPGEEGGGAGDIQIDTKLRRAHGCLLERHIESMDEDQRLRRPVGVPRRLHGGIHLSEERRDIERMDPLYAEHVVAEVETAEFRPPRRANLPESMGLRDIHLGHAERRLPGPLVAETVAQRLPIRAKPDRKHLAGRFFARRHGAHRIRASESPVVGRAPPSRRWPVDDRQQFDHLGQASPVALLGLGPFLLDVPQDQSFDLSGDVMGPRPVPRFHGRFELAEEPRQFIHRLVSVEMPVMLPVTPSRCLPARRGRSRPRAAPSPFSPDRRCRLPCDDRSAG